MEYQVNTSYNTNLNANPRALIKKLLIQKRLTISLALGMLLTLSGLYFNQLNTPATANAATTPEACFAYTVEDGEATITDYYDHEDDDSDKPACPRDVDIPNTIDGSIVTTIGNNAFKGKLLTTVYLPPTITAIGPSSFEGGSLTTLSIPNSVISVGINAFRDNELTSVSIPGSIKAIEYKTFFNNQLTFVAIAEGVEKIDREAFADNFIKEIVLPNSLSDLSDQAFSNNNRGLSDDDIDQHMNALEQQRLSWADPDNPNFLEEKAYNLAFFNSYREMMSNTLIAAYTSDPNNPNNLLEPEILLLANEEDFAGEPFEPFGASDLNDNGKLDSIYIGTYLLNPAHLKLTYQDQDGNTITPPAGAPTMITASTGFDSTANSGLGSYDASDSSDIYSYRIPDNPDGEVKYYYKAGNSLTRTITPPTIPGYISNGDVNVNIASLAPGANEVVLTYTTNSSNNGGDNNNNPSSPPITVTTPSSSNGSSSHNTTAITGTPTISKRPTFSGVTTPNSTVTVTVHSDPVTCTTTADAQGNWSCTLDQDLPSGEHTVYINITKPDNSTEELGPYTVTVQDNAQATITNKTPLANTGSKIMLGVSLVATIVTGVAIGLQKRSKLRRYVA